jgi:predicted NBD/HSP70 family sugar kinase
MLRIGVDLGGTKIEVAAFDAAGHESLRRRVPTPAGDYEGTVATVAALVREAEDELGASGSVGVATPGARSLATGLMRNCNSTCLNGRDLQSDLERALARPVRLANDANCFALAEAIDGAARGAPIVFGAILGTGVGAGIVVEGRVLTGANAIAGEWDTTRFPCRERATCRCLRATADAQAASRPISAARRSSATMRAATAGRSMPRGSPSVPGQATARATRRSRATRNGSRVRSPR